MDENFPPENHAAGTSRIFQNEWRKRMRKKKAEKAFYSKAYKRNLERRKNQKKEMAGTCWYPLGQRPAVKTQKGQMKTKASNNNTFLVVGVSDPRFLFPAEVEREKKGSLKGNQQGKKTKG